MKLRAKLIVVLIPLVAIPIAVIGWVAYTQQKDNVEVEALQQLNSLIGQIAMNVEFRFEAARADALLLGESQVLANYLLVEDDSLRYQLMQPTLLKLFANLQRVNRQYYEIRVLLPDGYEDTRSAASVLPNVSEEEGQTSYFLAMTQATENLLVQVVHNVDTSEPSVLISNRIALVDTSIDPILAKPKLRGYLVISMNLDFLRTLTDEVVLGYRGHICFADKSGRILFSPKNLDHGAFLNDRSADLLRASADTQSLLRTAHMEEAYILLGRRLHENLYVYAGLPEAAVLASTRRIAWVALATILGSILITTALLYSFLRSLLLNPLARLEEAVLEVGAGDQVADTGIRRNDEIGQLAVSFEDMSKNLRNSQEEIRNLAHHDTLTGLPNRHRFTQLLERALVHARRNDQILALMFLDLDDFKRVNDTLGHQTGDALLRAIAERLTAVLRPDDYLALQENHNAVARLGGDEFVVLLPRLENSLNAGSVARRTLDALARSIQIEGHEFEVNASIGITVFPEDGETVDELVKCADIAMYHAKEQGKNHFQFYTRDLNVALLQRVEMEGALRNALICDELMLHYQPQVDLCSGEIIGVEALVRWNNAKRGLVSPGEFIPLAEEIGLIIPIGEWVLREACRQNKAWQDAGLRPVPVAVNVSGRQFSGVGLENSIRQILAETGLSTRYLDVELTETCVMDKPGEAIATLASLKLLGIQISMDDFGTGYSSMGILKRSSIDLLKIDRDFIKDITSSPSDAAITKAIIAMGHSLGLRIVAEGVEQIDQLEFLRAHGCDRIQGFLISKPVNSDKMAKLLALTHAPLPQFQPQGAHPKGHQAHPRFKVVKSSDD